MTKRPEETHLTYNAAKNLATRSALTDEKAMSFMFKRACDTSKFSAISAEITYGDTQRYLANQNNLREYLFSSLLPRLCPTCKVIWDSAIDGVDVVDKVNERKGNL